MHLIRRSLRSLTAFGVVSSATLARPAGLPIPANVGPGRGIMWGMKLPALALAALLLVGCSSVRAAFPAAPASLKESCTALRSVLAEFGQSVPDGARYSTYAPKVKALADAGDQSTKDAFAPLVAAMEKGARGESAVKEQAAATIKLAAICGTAGAPLT